MAERANASSKVAPALLDKVIKSELEQEVVIDISLPAEEGGDGLSVVERNQLDDWSPITESRNGNSFTATFHLLCSGIGFQALLLPMAFVSLGWSWGIICLTIAFSWQLYTTWLLVELHESNAQMGIRYSRFLHLSIVAFGAKWGKLLAMFPTMYLSIGTCVQFIITGASTMEMLFQIMCENNVQCKSNTLTGAQWFLVFVCLAIFIAQFFPNLNSLAPVSLIGSIAVVAYCTLLWALSFDHKNGGASFASIEKGVEDHVGVRDVFNGVGIILLSFRGHNLVLEIQGTMPTSVNKPSRKPMWCGVTVSYILVAMCLYPLTIVGHWAYGSKISSGGILASFTKFHQNNTSKYVIGVVLLIIIINYVCSFQIYAMPIFDNLQRMYASKKNKPCPRWLRSAIKALFGGFIYFIAVALPFMPSLGPLIGSVALVLTFSYPCFMWIAIKKPRRFSRIWCINLGFGCSGILCCVLIFIGALWSLVVNGLDANFFNPR